MHLICSGCCGFTENSNCNCSVSERGEQAINAVVVLNWGGENREEVWVIPCLLMGSTFSVEDQQRVTCRKTFLSMPAWLLCSAERLQRESPAAAPSAWAAETSRRLLRVTGCLVSAAEDLLTSSLPRLLTLKLLESRFISLWDFPASLTRDYCGLLLPPSPQHKTSGRGPLLVLSSVCVQWCSLSCGGLEFRSLWKQEVLSGQNNLLPVWPVGREADGVCPPAAAWPSFW